MHLHLQGLPRADPDETHEQRITACYERWLEGEARWVDLVALLNARSPQQVARMEKRMGLS